MKILGKLDQDIEVLVTVAAGLHISTIEVSEQRGEAGPSSDQNASYDNARIQELRCARVILGGIELMHMIAKGQIEE